MHSNVKKMRIYARAIWALFARRPFALSLDLTNVCSLHCPMCYWQADKKDKELTDDEWVALVREKAKEGITHCTYVGGEPLLRKDLIKELIKSFPINWIVTNGSLPIPKMDNAHFLVSVDGTEKIHDKIRTKGLYQKVKKNICNREDIITNTTIFNVNKDEPRKLLEEWSKTKIKGMTFNFATKMKGTDSSFYLNDNEKNKVIDELIKLKRKYKQFMLISKNWLEEQRPERVKLWHRNCPARYFSTSLASDGTVKKPCILGKKAICSSCGCHVPVIIRSIGTFDIETFHILTRMM